MVGPAPLHKGMKTPRYSRVLRVNYLGITLNDQFSRIERSEGFSGGVEGVVNKDKGFSAVSPE